MFMYSCFLQHINNGMNTISNHLFNNVIYTYNTPGMVGKKTFHVHKLHLVLLTFPPNSNLV